jgi:hypothetical protein
MVAALIGCVAGAALASDTRAMLEQAGFTAIALTPKPDYVRGMLDFIDPLYARIVQALPPGAEVTDSVVSLSIEAVKPAR